jgi:hypothetical protein
MTLGREPWEEEYERMYDAQKTIKLAAGFLPR